MRRRAVTAVTAVSLALAGPLALLSSPASAAPVAAPARPWDFNGDGFPDLAVAAPGLDAGSVDGGGAVVAVASSADGLNSSRKVITQETTGVAGNASITGYWGDPSASADIDADGYADLVVSGDTVLLGSKDGLTGAGSYTLSDTDGPRGGVVFGDFDDDGSLDLAVGLPAQDFVTGQTYKAPGAVRVYRGGGKLEQSRSYLLQGNRSAARGDVGFGATLAAADLDGDGVTDLVVGSAGPGNPDDEGYSGPGSVSACPGRAGQDLAACTQLVRSNQYAGGETLAVANVVGTARPEVVLGVPFPELNQGGSSKARLGGVVEILTLSGSGRATTATVTDLAQNSTGVRGTGELYDGFGSAVVLGDLDRDGFADLVVGAPSEDVGKVRDTGRVTVVYGGATGYRTSGGKIYDQSTKGVPGKNEKGDAFGYALALLDHDRDQRLDLDVGVPGENVDQGSVLTLAGRGTSFTTSGSSTFTLKSLKISQGSNVVPTFGQDLGG